ncbi:hypothetical protein [Vreelandella olivaria]|uniref:hypothetical protein n=1 Tax=Vreelandella olivaria TaxID=390919 RepID=UPI00201EE752|nr:hypothetical protein [Halomonas olivaria]
MRIKTVEAFLISHRGKIIWLMIAAAFLHAAVRFWGDWKYFFGVLLFHVLFGQAVQAYLWGRDIFLGGGVVRVNDGKGVRLIAFIIYFVLYLAVFPLGDFIRGPNR